MKKSFNIFCCFAFAAVLTVGCSDDSGEGYDPDIRFSKTGDVTFIASIENCATRASLVGTGETRWQGEDAISVICTDGTAVEFSIDGTGDTRKAFFTGTIPAGKELGSYALYPASTNLSGSTVSVELPAQISPSSEGSCAVMAARIEDSYEITFNHLMSYLKVRLDNVSDQAVKIELKSDKCLSGVFSATIPGAFETGFAAQDGSDGLTVTLPEKKEPTVTLNFPVPVGEYGSLTAVGYDANGANIGEVECLSAPIYADLADLRSLSAAMPKYDAKEPIEGTALVAGIYWALGNLQHVVGSTDEGFQTDWRLAPQQWEFVNSENSTSGSAVTFSATDYSQYDHFNWGGIDSPFDNATTSMSMASVGTDISGKMYTSQDCSVPTMDFAAAKYGDLAYWASNGKFRMPKPSELQKLMDEASSQYGSYKIGEGKVITGILFTNPEGERVQSDVEVVFTAEDIAKGLFLPKGGRRYNAQALTVNVQGTQGTYWASESITGSGANQPSYGTVLHIASAKITFPYWNAAFDAKAGFMIRPVYIE